MDRMGRVLLMGVMALAWGCSRDAASPSRSQPAAPVKPALPAAGPAAPNPLPVRALVPLPGEAPGCALRRAEADICVDVPTACECPEASPGDDSKHLADDLLGGTVRDAGLGLGGAAFPRDTPSALPQYVYDTAACVGYDRAACRRAAHAPAY